MSSLSSVLGSIVKGSLRKMTDLLLRFIVIVETESKCKLTHQSAPTFEILIYWEMLNIFFKYCHCRSTLWNLGNYLEDNQESYKI